MKIFVTHNPEDREMYFHWAMEPLKALGEVVLNPTDRNLTTEEVIDTRGLSLMKPGAFLVNCSRGDLIDEDALEEAYKAGRLSGLAMDVGRAMDQRPSQRVAELPGVVATPHLGGLTVQAAEPQAMSPVEQIQAILDGQMPPRAVNPEHATRLQAYWEG